MVKAPEPSIEVPGLFQRREREGERERERERRARECERKIPLLVCSNHLLT
jgi:hypothetical protein